MIKKATRRTAYVHGLPSLGFRKNMMDVRFAASIRNTMEKHKKSRSRALYQNLKKYREAIRDAVAMTPSRKGSILIVHLPRPDRTPAPASRAPPRVGAKNR